MKRSELAIAFLLLGILGVLTYVVYRKTMANDCEESFEAFPDGPSNLSGYSDYKSGGIGFLSEREVYNPVIPVNAAGYSCPVSITQLDVSRLPQTHISTVLKGTYDKTESPLKVSDGQVVTLTQVVEPIERNVVALSRGKGEPISTGILLSPQLLLTARHNIEGLSMGEISIRLGYQIQEYGMNYGEVLGVQGVAEEDDELDYAILRLSEPVKDFSPFDLELCEYFSGESVFIHHPRGGPKQVSVHATIESAQYPLFYGGFHDSEKGSSGGANCCWDTSAGRPKLFAMHLLGEFDGQKTIIARWMKDLRDNSLILSRMFGKKGVRAANFYEEVSVSAAPLARAEYSAEYRKNMERVDRPIEYPALNAAVSAGNANLAYHHIIPIGDMEFLWMLGKEYKKIEEILKSISHKGEHTCDEDGRLTINAVAWSPWDIFIGPSCRKDDPKDGGRKEEIIPPSFNKNKWKAISDLYDAIQKCWAARYSVSQVNEAASAYRSDLVGQLDQRNGTGNVGQDMRMFAPFDNTKKRRRQVTEKEKGYLASLEELRKALKALQQCVSAKNEVHSTIIFHGDAGDWVHCGYETDRNGVNHNRYKLKGSSSSHGPRAGFR